ncbi:MAG: DEAD/DEAH box helicase [Chloroflexales bacterium]
MPSDPAHAAALALKARLPRSWPAFFERHGNFTPAQLVAIPPLLDGANLLLCAPTASGKTAAVLAPLIERHLPPRRPPSQLAILYLVPTRALVSDLYARLEQPLGTLGLRLGVKTRDSAFRTAAPPDLLITTPESADALLASAAPIFAGLRALVIDELHLFDGTPRGDQMRAVLSRIRAVRTYAATRGDAPDSTIQYAALSATLSDPQATAARYFTSAQVVQAGGGRHLEAELVAMDGDGDAALATYLSDFRRRGWRKALVFCNSRAEVEHYAAVTRPNSPFGSAVFVHYSNIEAARRREIEQQFAAADSAVCFTSSTLELGIDIGSVDVVALIGPPGSRASFVQRIGRGNRRGRSLRAICGYRTPLERLQFEALIADPPALAPILPPLVPVLPPLVPVLPPPASRLPPPTLLPPASCLPPPALSPQPSALSPSFRPSVAVQQIFSLIKQSPTAALRQTPLTQLFTGLLSDADVTALLGYLEQRSYLKAGRPGEWRAGPRLNKLLDEQSAKYVSLSIFSNIQSAAMPPVAIRDQHTGQTLAMVDALWLDRDELTLEGRTIDVAWSDGEGLWINSRPGGEETLAAIYRSARQLLSYDLARMLPLQMGLDPQLATLVPLPSGCWCFHWLGDLYGLALRDLLRYTLPAEDSPVPGLALHLPQPPQTLPLFNADQVQRYLRDNYRQYEPLLDLGAFQQLLPTPLRQQSVVDMFDVPGFLTATNALRLAPAPEAIVGDLADLVGAQE